MLSFEKISLKLLPLSSLEKRHWSTIWSQLFVQYFVSLQRRPPPSWPQSEGVSWGGGINFPHHPNLAPPHGSFLKTFLWKPVRHFLPDLKGLCIIKAMYPRLSFNFFAKNTFFMRMGVSGWRTRWTAQSHLLSYKSRYSHSHLTSYKSRYSNLTIYKSW